MWPERHHAAAATPRHGAAPNGAGGSGKLSTDLWGRQQQTFAPAWVAVTLVIQYQALVAR
jgi:hypothetical protein